MTDLIITQQALDNRQIRLNVVVPDDRTEKVLREAARRLAKNYRFPGFRPGKAPYQIIAQRVGRAALLEEALQEIGPLVYLEAVEAAGLEPYGPATLTEVVPEPLMLTYEVPLAPVANLGDYRSLRVDAPTLDEAEIEKHVQDDLSRMVAGDDTYWAPVERPTEYGDLITIGLELMVDGEVVLENQDWDFSPSATTYTLLPEFDAAFIGMRSGESKSFVAVFPDTNDNSWPGKEGHFNVTVKAIKGKVEASYDDAFAVKHGFENTEDMFQKLRAHASAHLQVSANASYRQKVIEQLIASAELSYPPAAIERQTEVLMAEQENYFKAYGFESTAEVLRLQDRTEDEYRQELRPDAEVRLRRDLALEAIADAERFPVSAYEMDKLLLDSLGDQRQQLAEMRKALATNEDYRAWLTTRIRHRKAHELIIAIARGEQVPAPGQHAAAEAPPAVATESERPKARVIEPAAETEAASQPDGAPDATVTPSHDD